MRPAATHSGRSVGCPSAQHRELVTEDTDGGEGDPLALRGGLREIHSIQLSIEEPSMVQHGQLFKLKTKSAHGQPLRA